MRRQASLGIFINLALLVFIIAFAFASVSFANEGPITPGPESQDTESLPPPAPPPEPPSTMVPRQIKGDYIFEETYYQGGEFQYLLIKTTYINGAISYYRREYSDAIYDGIYTQYSDSWVPVSSIRVLPKENFTYKGRPARNTVIYDGTYLYVETSSARHPTSWHLGFKQLLVLGWESASASQKATKLVIILAFDLIFDALVLALAFLLIRKRELIRTWKFIGYVLVAVCFGLAADFISGTIGRSLSPGANASVFYTGAFIILTSLFALLFIFFFDWALTKGFWNTETSKAMTVALMMAVITNPVFFYLWARK